MSATRRSQRRWRQRESRRRGAVGVRLPAEGARHAGRDAVRLHPVPVVVEMENDHVVLRDELSLGLVGLVGRERLDGVLVRIEGGLVRHHQVAAVTRRTLQHGKCRHHRRGDTAYGRLWPSRHDAVDRLGQPWNADACLDPLDDLRRGQLVARNLACEADGTDRPEEVASCQHGRDSRTADVGRPRPSARSAKHLPRSCVRVFAAIDDHRAVDDDVLDPGGVLSWLLEGRAIDHARRSVLEAEHGGVACTVAAEDGGECPDADAGAPADAATLPAGDRSEIETADAG